MKRKFYNVLKKNCTNARKREDSIPNRGGMIVIVEGKIDVKEEDVEEMSQNKDAINCDANNTIRGFLYLL